MKRVFTSVLLIPPIVYVVLWSPRWLFLGLLATVALICYHEYCGIAAAYGGKLNPAGYAAGLIVMAADETGTLLLVVTLLALSFMLGASELSKALPRASLLVLGIIYVFGSWKCAIPLRAHSPYWLLFALLLTWVGDIAAYYVGRTIGRHKLSPRISPGKSWEGAAASIIASVLFGFFFLKQFAPSMPTINAVMFPAAANVVGQIGDLTESALKRGAGVKDSGRLLPGHGGLLDRVDSTLFTLPFVYLFLPRS